MSAHTFESVIVQVTSHIIVNQSISKILPASLDIHAVMCYYIVVRGWPNAPSSKHCIERINKEWLTKMN